MPVMQISETPLFERNIQHMVPGIVVMLMSMVKENFQILDFLKKHLV